MTKTGSKPRPGKLARQLIRAHTYSETGGTWIAWTELLLTLLFVVHTTVYESILFFICIRSLRICIGWFDIHRAGWVAYRAEWFSSVAPSYAKSYEKRRARRT